VDGGGGETVQRHSGKKRGVTNFKGGEDLSLMKKKCWGGKGGEGEDAEEKAQRPRCATSPFNSKRKSSVRMWG